MTIISFLLLKTQNYLFLYLSYQQKVIKNYQNFLAKDFKDQLIGMNVKQIKSNFVGVNRLFVLVYTIEANNAKRFNARKYYLPKGIIKIM